VVDLSHFGQAQGLPYIPAPGVVGCSDLGNLLVGQFAVGAAHHPAQFAGVYKNLLLQSLGE